MIFSRRYNNDEMYDLYSGSEAIIIILQKLIRYLHNKKTSNDNDDRGRFVADSIFVHEHTCKSTIHSSDIIKVKSALSWVNQVYLVQNYNLPNLSWNKSIIDTRHKLNKANLQVRASLNESVRYKQFFIYTSLPFAAAVISIS